MGITTHVWTGLGADFRKEIKPHLSKGTLEKAHEIGKVVVTALAHIYVRHVSIYHVVKGKLIFTYGGEPLYFSYSITTSHRS